MDNKLKVVGDENRQIQASSKLLTEMGEKFGLEPNELKMTLITQCFQGGAASDGQLLMLLSFARQYDLNPLAGECYAYISKKTGLMRIGVMVDGWSKIADRDARYDGQEIEYHADTAGNVTAITSKTYVKDRSHPTAYRAEMREWKQDTDPDKPWAKMPIHQLYVKARNQGIRFAFGISAYDRDDIENLKRDEIDITPNTARQGQISGPAVTSEPKPATKAETQSQPTPEPQQTKDELIDQIISPNRPFVATVLPDRVTTEHENLQDDATPGAAEPATEPASVSTQPEVVNDDAALRAELYKTIEGLPPARVNVLLAQQGVTKKEDLNTEQIRMALRILNKGKK